MWAEKMGFLPLFSTFLVFGGSAVDFRWLAGEGRMEEIVAVVGVA